VATTRSRPRGREHARPSTGGVVAEHSTKIFAIGISGIVVITAFLALTSIGHVIDAATQHFMLYYAGVFALLALCASVGLGLIATDRLFLNPSHRVFIQSAHRAASFGAVAFLIIHITTEILAQRVHVLDAVVPFLSPFRTFYIGLGTISSDLIILLVITGIMRGRFNGSGKAWRWRAIHYTSYVSFVFGIWHGLLAGRPAKPYVDWSYGLLIAFVLVGLAVRILSDSLKPKETHSAPPVPVSASSASAPMRAAAMFAQLSAAARNVRADQPMMSAVVSGQVGGARTGDMPMLTAPIPAGPGRGGDDGARQPFYEPGYEGPPRYLGAPSRPVSGPGTGSMPSASTGPMPQATTGPMRAAGTGPMPRAASGPMPRAASGPMPRVTGPMPPHPSGPMPRADYGPMPRAASGPMPRVSGPMPRPATGPMPRAWSGPMPPHPSGPMPRADYGPTPRAASGPMPRGGSGPMPRAASGAMGPPPTGPMPPHPSGPLPRVPSGPDPRAARGPRPSAPSGPMPRAGGDPGADRGWQQDRGGQPRADWNDGSYDNSYDPRNRSYDDGYGQGGYDPGYGAYNGPYASYEPQPPWDGGFPEPDPRLKYREPGPGMPGYRGSRDHRYGGDRRG